MSDKEIRLECLRLAAQRLPAAPIEDLYAEAKRLLAFVEGFDEVTTVDGRPAVGRRL